MFGASTGSGATRMETHLERAPLLERLTMVSKHTIPDERESDEQKRKKNNNAPFTQQLVDPGWFNCCSAFSKMFCRSPGPVL